METELVIVDKREGVATVALNRPEKRNALDSALEESLAAAFEALKEDADTRVVVLRGSGNSFCAGGDVRALMRKHGKTKVENRFDTLKITMRALCAITTLRQPVIATVRGAAVGAGCNLALACDLIIASENAVFGEVFVKMGLASDWGGTYFLPRRVGLARAKQLYLTGKMIDAREAERIGMINQVVPDAALESTVDKLARELAAGPSRALAFLKAQLNSGLEKSLAEVLRDEAEVFSILLHSADHQEAAEAFLSKRPPRFSGK